MGNKKKLTQKDLNPYKYSDSNKRYQTYDYYTRHTFGGKCARIPLNCGFTCPNKDGTRGVGGCIYCFEGSSAAKGYSIKEQYENAKNALSSKWNVDKFIPYLQAGSNTYARPEKLREAYEEAASLPGAVSLCIATRADCLEDGAVSEIIRISKKIPVTVELGLQTSNDAVARFIGRGHDFGEFLEGYAKLKNTDVSLGIHIINGLPCETEEDMMKTASDVASLEPDQVKIHLLHVIKGTRLHEIYKSGNYVPMNLEDYVRITASQIEILPERAVIARVTGDAPADLLEAPDWCRRKTEVTNEIDKELYRRNSWQGRLFGKNV